MEREKQLAQRDVETEKKKAEELARERDILTKLNSQAENASHKHMEMIRLNENNRRTLEQEIAGYKHESRKQQKVCTFDAFLHGAHDTLLDRRAPGSFAKAPLSPNASSGQLQMMMAQQRKLRLIICSNLCMRWLRAHDAW